MGWRVCVSAYGRVARLLCGWRSARVWRAGGVKLAVGNLRIARYGSFVCKVLLCGSVPSCAG